MQSNKDPPPFSYKIVRHKEVFKFLLILYLKDVALQIRRHNFVQTKGGSDVTQWTFRLPNKV